MIASSEAISRKKANSRVADENAVTVRSAPSSRWKHRVSLLCEILLAPLSILSCGLSHQTTSYISGNADGVWTSAEARTSEVTHLMVRDSLRYAILM